MPPPKTPPYPPSRKPRGLRLWATLLLGLLGGTGCVTPRLPRGAIETTGGEALAPSQPLPSALAPVAPPSSPPLSLLPPAKAAEGAKLGVKLRLRAVGDIMLGTDFPEGHLPPGEANILEGVAPLLRDADVSFANLEGPLCDGGETTKCKEGSRCYAFRMPGRFTGYLKAAGLHVVSTANNHSGDFGEECRRQTEAFLDEAGIAWSGPPGSIAWLERHGRRVALLAFHASPHTNNLNDLPAALALLAQAKRGGAHWVVVSFHGGAEGAFATRVAQGKEIFLKEDRGDLRRFARAMVEGGADVVLGHGPHVLRGMELWKGKLIAYSLGNFATYGRFGLAGPLGIGAILEVVLDEEGHFTEGRVFSTQQVGRGIVLPDEGGKAFLALRELSGLDFPQTGLGLGVDGQLYRGVVEGLRVFKFLNSLLTGE